MKSDVAVIYDSLNDLAGSLIEIGLSEAVRQDSEKDIVEFLTTSLVWWGDHGYRLEVSNAHN